MERRKEAVVEVKELSEYVCSPAEAALSIAFGKAVLSCFQIFGFADHCACVIETVDEMEILVAENKQLKAQLRFVGSSSSELAKSH